MESPLRVQNCVSAYAILSVALRHQKYKNICRKYKKYKNETTYIL